MLICVFYAFLVDLVSLPRGFLCSVVFLQKLACFLVPPVQEQLVFLERILVLVWEQPLLQGLLQQVVSSQVLVLLQQILIHLVQMRLVMHQPLNEWLRLLRLQLVLLNLFGRKSLRFFYFQWLLWLQSQSAIVVRGFGQRSRLLIGSQEYRNPQSVKRQSGLLIRRSIVPSSFLKTEMAEVDLFEEGTEVFERIEWELQSELLTGPIADGVIFGPKN